MLRPLCSCTVRGTGSGARADCALHTAALHAGVSCRCVVLTSASCSCCSEPPLTTKTATFGGCLDYIWISPHLQVSSA